MREILFRGKLVYNGMWIYGGLYKEPFDDIKDGKLYIITASLEYAGNANEVIPESIGQYTGLTDKNGKKIFEGDKIKLTQGIGTVEWFKTQSRFMIWLPKSNKFASFLAGIEYEVIGNIHDNPELLEKV